MASNLLFIVIRDDAVLIFQRLFDSYRWLQTESGEVERGCYFDLSSESAFQIMPQMALRKQKYYEIDTVLHNLFHLLLPLKEYDDSSVIYNSNTWLFCRRSEDSIVIHPSREADSESSICIKDVWKAFLSSRMKQWQEQNECLPSHAFVIFPDYVIQTAEAMITEILQDCGISTVHCLFSSSIFPSYGLRTASTVSTASTISDANDGCWIHFDLSDSYIHACVSQGDHVLSEKHVTFNATNSPLNTLSTLAFRLLGCPTSQLTPEQTLLCTRQIYLQCKTGISNNAERLLLHDDDSPRTVLFLASVPSSLFSVPSVSITNELISRTFRESTYIPTLRDLLHDVLKEAPPPSNTRHIAVEGLFSSLFCVRQLFHTTGLPTVYRGTDSLFAQHCTERLQVLQPALCNHFRFLDHTLAVTFQDGFALPLLDKGVPLPAQHSTKLSFSFTSSRTITLFFLRGDSVLAEENVPVLQLPLHYEQTPATADSVTVTVAVKVDAECNLIVHTTDSFGGRSTVSVAARDFLNPPATALPLSERPRGPRGPQCSRQGSYYQGEAAGGKAEGFGRLYDAQNQLKYEGQWHDGAFCGRGIYYTSQGEMVAGSFRDGRVEGYAVWYNALGLVVRQGVFHGETIEEETPPHAVELAEEELDLVAPPMEEEAGRVHYEGERENGVPHGYGVLFGKDGEKVYEGSFVHGTFTGAGSLYEHGRLKCRGTFQNGMLTGEGIVFSPRGNVVMKGEFLGGTPWGMCLEYSDDAQHTLLYRGFFLKGRREGLGRMWQAGCPEPRLGYFLHGVAFAGGFLMVVARLADGCCAVDVESRQCRSVLLRQFVTLSLNGMAARLLSQRLRQKAAAVLFESLFVDSKESRVGER